MDKKAVVIYTSKRGSTKQYAEWIHEELSKICECDLFAFEESKKINLYEYDLIIYGGWIRGSGIVNFDVLRSRLDGELLDKMIVFGAGVANETPENYMQVWSLNIGKIDPKNKHKAILYILGGRYDPAKVTGFDGMLMKISKKVMLSGATASASEAAMLMKDRIENGCDLVKRENIDALIKDAKKKLNL